jgi:hypothetical protein
MPRPSTARLKAAPPPSKTVRTAWLAVGCLAVLALSGCSKAPTDATGAVAPGTDDADAAGRSSTSASLPAPVLFLNLTLGEQTVSFSSAAADEPGTGASNTTSGLVNGTAPLEVAFTFGASPAPAKATWTLSFGAGGNETAGDRLPGAANHTYVDQGEFNVTFTLKVGNATAQRLDATVRIAAGNVTVEERPVVLLLTTQFTGSLPIDGATVATHPFTVPAGALRIMFGYTSDHIGLFSAIAALNDPSGSQQVDSLTVCGAVLTPGAASDHCDMVVEADGELAVGDWTAEVDYQAGQVTEDYTLDVQVFGYPAA